MRPSILDRLIDLEPGVSGEPVHYRSISYNQLRESVERDLENLLNTKCFGSEILVSYRELQKSPLTYGISDFTAKNPSVPVVRLELRHEIEHAITVFEPRLKNVSVKFENREKGERHLKFKITALLQMGEESEPVNFSTFYDINRCEYNISS
jgi:type VI secretion system protein ImpF